MKQRLFTQILGLMLSLSLSVAAVASNSINSVGVANLEGGGLVVKIALKEKLPALPSSFAISNPSRIAFDFKNTASSLDKNTVEVGKGALTSINIVQAGERTRLVMNLLRPVTYESKIDGNNLLVTLHAVNAGTETSSSTLFAAPEPGDQVHAIRDIDFHRGKNGEARVEVNLSDANTGIDVSRQGTGIVIQFIKTKLPRNLERRLDVVDFGTPVNTIDTYTQGDNVKMVIDPKGLWEQSAYQTDDKFILEVKPVAVDPNKLVQGSRPGYSGNKLSLDFRNTDVRSLLFAIADFTGLNIVISDTVSGNLTLRLKDVPWDQALDIILQQKGLGMTKVGNVVMIAPSAEIAARAKLELEGKQKISELEETRTESIQLNYQKATDVQKILGNEKQRILSKRGSVVVDPITNTLFVQDTPSKLEEVRQFVQKIDTPVRQVMIEARIVEATSNFGKNLGVKLGYSNTTGGTAQNSGNPVIQLGGSQTAGSGAQGFGGTNTATYANNVVGIGRRVCSAESLGATACSLASAELDHRISAVLRRSAGSVGVAQLHPEVLAEVAGCLDNPGFDHDLPDGSVDFLDELPDFLEFGGRVLHEQGIRDRVNDHAAPLGKYPLLLVAQYFLYVGGLLVIELNAFGAGFLKLGNLLLALQFELCPGCDFRAGRDHHDIADLGHAKSLLLQDDVQRLVPGNVLEPQCQVS